MINELEYLYSLQNDAGEVVKKFTLKIFSTYESTVPIPLASSILIEKNGIKYLLSAAHVFADNHISSLCFIFKNINLIPVEGDLLYSLIYNNTISNKADIGIIKLESSVVEMLKKEGKEFYSIDSINLDLDENKFGHILMFGYPNTKSKINIQAKKIKLNALCYYTKILNKNLIDYNFDFLMKFELVKNKMKRMNTNELIKGPKLDGCSGCGLWSYAKIFVASDESPNLILRGVFIEYLENLSLGVGVKINKINSIIENNFEKY